MFIFCRGRFVTKDENSKSSKTIISVLVTKAKWRQSKHTHSWAVLWYYVCTFNLELGTSSASYACCTATHEPVKVCDTYSVLSKTKITRRMMISGISVSSNILVHVRTTMSTMQYCCVHYCSDVTWLQAAMQALGMECKHDLTAERTL